MKTICARFGVVMLLSACGGTTTGPVTPTGPGPYDPLTQQNVVGRSFSDNQAPFVEVDGTQSGAVGTFNVSLKSISSTEYDVTINGVTTRVTDNGSTGWVSQDGSLTLHAYYITNNGQNGPQMEFLGEIIDTNTNLHYLGGFSDGIRTAFADMPTAGTATYGGYMDSADGTGAVNSTGNVSLFADFATGQISGQLDGLLPFQPGAVFDLVPVTISGNGFNTTLTSNDVTVLNSSLNGRFYGDKALEAGGTASVQTSSGNGVGVFYTVQ